MDYETVTGFDIPLRQLNDEEKSREITFLRFNEFHMHAGEDFSDCCGSDIDVKLFIEFLEEKRPELKVFFADEIREMDLLWLDDLLDVKEIYCDEINASDYKSMDVEDLFYVDLAEFCNKDEDQKSKVNQILIQVSGD